MTLQELILEVRRRSDMEDTDFVTDEEVTNYINNSASELYDILVGKFEDYYIQEPLEFNLDGTSNSYDLPADFYKLKAVDRAMYGNNDWVNVDSFNFNERNRTNTNIKYRLVGKKLLFTPKDQASGSYKIWYIPQSPKLVNATDVLDTVSGWEEYVIVDASMKCVQKEESDVSVLLNQKQFLLQRIEQLANNRDVGSAEKISDVYKGYWFEEGE